jgi:hypothetical protein
VTSRDIRKVDTEDGADVGGLTGLHELDDAVEPVAVGESKGVHAVVGGAFDEDVGMRAAVPQ